MHSDPADKIPIEGAEAEDAVTELLRLLLREHYDAAKKHPATQLLRSMLSVGGRFHIPVVDLAAVLPDVESRELKGLHIALYEGSRPNDDWYMTLLDQFFSTGGRGSLLALNEYGSYVGSCRIQYGPPRKREAAPGPPLQMVPRASQFPPKPRSISYDVEDRFREYATRLLDHFGGPASVVWICLGPRDENSLQWGGSLFAVIGATSPELNPSVLNSAVERVYAVLSGAFHRTIVDSGHREEAAHRLQLTYFAFGHDLKNRLDELGMAGLRSAIRDSAPDLLPKVNACYERLQVLYGMCGVFSAVAKSDKGILPAAWMASATGPWTPGYRPRKKDRAALHEALADAVAAFAYVVVDPTEPLIVRSINAREARRVKRPESYHATLPQFRPNDAEPHLCFLCGLAELCRNAVDAALGADTADPHVDFSVDVSDALVATVTLYNPVGRNLEPSKSIELLSELFMDFNQVVELTQAEPIKGYVHGRGTAEYVRSRFVYSPGNLRFAQGRKTS